MDFGGPIKEMECQTDRQGCGTALCGSEIGTFNCSTFLTLGQCPINNIKAVTGTFLLSVNRFSFSYCLPPKSMKKFFFAFFHHQ
jgi:hypothetical protein